MAINKKILIGFVGMMRFLSIAPFIGGLFFNADGVSMLVNRNDYMPGVMTIDSTIASADGYSSHQTVYAVGHVDSVSTMLQCGSADDPETADLLYSLLLKEKVTRPVWYRPDGKLTRARLPDEKSYPYTTILKKLILYIIMLNGPLIFLTIWHRSLKRQIKEQENERNHQ